MIMIAIASNHLYVYLSDHSVKELLIFSFSCIVCGTVVADGSAPARSGMYVGIGGGYGLVNVSQSIYAKGVSNVYDEGTTTLSNIGTADGSTNNWDNSQSTFAPLGQIGYFAHFDDDTDWLWGAKFLYRYYGTTSSQYNVSVPQAGTFTSATTGAVTPFTGYEVINPAQTSVNSQLGLLAYIGKSFGNSRVYFGAGPAAFQIQSNMIGNIGYAYIPYPTLNSITGNPVNLSTNTWLVGGAFEVGGSYYLDQSWFIDANYSFGITATQSVSYSTQFTNTASGQTTVGTNLVQPSQSITTQSLSVSINRAF
mgnify:CR=1 FL=1